jgi:hypothetical protein
VEERFFKISPLFSYTFIYILSLETAPLPPPSVSFYTNIFWWGGCAEETNQASLIYTLEGFVRNHLHWGWHTGLESTQTYRHLMSYHGHLWAYGMWNYASF